MTGVLAFVGGGEWSEGCTFDAELLAASEGSEVLVVPTAAAFEHPERHVERARTWFEPLGATVAGLDLLGRPDASDDEVVQRLRAARFVYLSGSSPFHLRSVLKDTPAWQALDSAWHAGAVVAASGEAAAVLGDPQVDPRGGAFTLGLGLVEQLAVVPHADTWTDDQARRTFSLAPRGIPVVAVDERTALIRQPDGSWHVGGAGSVQVFVDGQPAGLEALPS